MKAYAVESYEILEVFGRIENASYDAYTCWDAVKFCYEVLLEQELPNDMGHALQALALTEVWYATSACPVTRIVQPWDLLIFRVQSLASDHVGIMLTEGFYGTATKAMGVHKVHLSSSVHQLLQIARLHTREA